MIKIVEIERIAPRKKRVTVLYEGNNQCEAEFAVFSASRSYHKQTSKVDGDNVTIYLTVDS